MELHNAGNLTNMMFQRRDKEQSPTITDCLQKLLLQNKATEEQQTWNSKYKQSAVLIKDPPTSGKH